MDAGPEGRFRIHPRLIWEDRIMKGIVIAAVAAAVAATGVGTARAAPPPTQAPASEASGTPTNPLTFAGAKQVDDVQLGRITGMSNLAQVVSAQNSSNVSNNQINGNSQTGAIGFDASSFQNMNGLSVLSANTGNNVSINSSLNVNISLHP